MRDDAPTPKHRSSAQRAPVFAEMAGIWAEACRNEALRYTKNLGIMDLQRARECSGLERRFRHLEAQFIDWVHGERSPELRIADTIELKDLEAAAIELRVPCDLARSAAPR